MRDTSKQEDTTDDHFLGGRLLLRQPVRGHRAGHDAMLLAAVTQTRAGDVVVDLGAGVGAAGLAVACRPPGLDLVMVEIDPILAALARHNAAINDVAARVLVADVGDAEALRRAGIADGAADCVIMNPPFHADDRHRASPDAGKRLAHVSGSAALAVWMSAAHRLLKPRGVLTLIWRADDLPHVFESLAGRFGSLGLWPVHGRAGKPAVRVLVRTVKGGRAPLAIHPLLLIDGSDDIVEAALRGQGSLAAGAMSRNGRVS